jgi:hypothetical protein
MFKAIFILGLICWGLWQIKGYLLILLLILNAPATQPAEVPEPPAVQVVEVDPDMAELDRLIKEAEAEFAIHGGGWEGNDCDKD